MLTLFLLKKMAQNDSNVFKNPYFFWAHRFWVVLLQCLEMVRLGSLKQNEVK